MARQSWTVFYTGMVQGVGFRYTTRDIALGYEVTGYVKNLPDGRVELVAEGDQKEVKAFTDEVNRRMGRFIRDQVIQKAPGTRSYNDFEIWY